MNKNQNITQALWSSNFQNFDISACFEIYPNIFRFPVLSKCIRDKKNKTPGYDGDIFLVLTCYICILEEKMGSVLLLLPT